MTEQLVQLKMQGLGSDSSVAKTFYSTARPLPLRPSFRCLRVCEFICLRVLAGVWRGKHLPHVSLCPIPTIPSSVTDLSADHFADFK